MYIIIILVIMMVMMMMAGWLKVEETEETEAVFRGAYLTPHQPCVHLICDNTKYLSQRGGKVVCCLH